MEELVTYLARALVDRPDQVELRTQAVDGGTVLELKVAPEDVGKVIGRDGRTINAMRAVLADLSVGESPAGIASGIEFVLEGLHLTKRLNKDSVGTRAPYRGRG